MKCEIKHRYTGEVIVSVEIEADEKTSRSVCLGMTIKKSLSEGANLRYADLQGANLRYADLQGANLRYADLQGAYLQGAKLQDAYLQGAKLQDAYLQGAYLQGAYLQGAYLQGANLQGTYLQDAYLQGAKLQDAYLQGAKLQDAYLQGANLQGTYLQDAYLQGAYLQGATLPHFQLPPEEGEFLAWKKTTKGVAKIKITSDAKRTSTLVGRKCRASKVEVVEGFDGTTGPYFGGLIYETGAIVEVDDYDDDIRVECTRGIHFFMTKREAEEW